MMNLQTIYGGSITGDVKNEMGRPLSGVNITVQNHNIGTTSNQFGMFSLKNLSDGNYTIQFSHIGYKSQQISIQVETEQTHSQNIILTEELLRLEALVVTAQKKAEQKGSYFPVLSVSTKRIDGWIEIRIRDNGKGIPQEIREKFFNPFFTTKAAGKGTGLGLSISYDIVVQEHQGEIRVDSKEGEYTEFLIRIPVSSNPAT